MSIYSWMASHKGTVAVQGEEIPADLLYDELLKTFFRAFDGAIETRRDEWMIHFEGQYVSFKRDRLDIDFFGAELFGGYAIKSQLYLLAGGRYYNNSAVVITEQGERLSGKKGFVRFSAAMVVSGPCPE